MFCSTNHSLHKKISYWILKKCVPYFFTLDNSYTFVFGIFFDFAPFFGLEIHTPRYFGAVAILYVPFSGILHVLRGILPTPLLYFSTPIEFTRHSWASLHQKSRVASTLPSCRKCSHARLVFTSLVARYHAQFLSSQNLVAHVLSTNIDKYRLLLLSSNWCLNL